MQEIRDPDSINFPPFETEDLRKNLTVFLNMEVYDSVASCQRKVGNFKWGVYAFFDYDGEPVYVGQTNEKLRTRIRRHLTNQRTDAVAMSVLDPFEVSEIEVWPLPDFQDISGENKDAKAALDALEHQIHQFAIQNSHFSAVLNEKDPPTPTVGIDIPQSYRQRIVSDEVYAIRSHPDFRIARRALVIARLAQVISERKVQAGLRRVMLIQAKRLQWLAERRFIALGDDTEIDRGNGDENGSEEG